MFNDCQHESFDLNHNITFCKKCHVILIQSIVQTYNNHNSSKSNSNNSFNNPTFQQELRILNTSLRPKDIFVIIPEVNPLDTLKVILNQPKTVKICTQSSNCSFMEYLPKRTELVKLIRYYTRKYGTGEEIFSLSIFLLDIIMTNIKDSENLISNNASTSTNNLNKEYLTTACYLK